MYTTPKLERLGSLRQLTQYGIGQGSDLLGLWLNNATDGAASGAADGCTAGATGWTADYVGCRGSH